MRAAPHNKVSESAMPISMILGMADQQTHREAVCRQCREAIPEGARFCSHCHSYQDWRGWLPFSQTVLALLTALVSVVALSVPPIVKLIHTPRSGASLTAPSLDGTTLRIVAVNRGDAPAAFIHARMNSDYLAPATRIKLRNDADAIIPPGSKLLTFDIIPLLDEAASYNGSMEMMLTMVQKRPAPKTVISFEISQSDGRQEISVFPLDANDLFELLRANANRCSAVKNPDFLNGCIGYGTLSDKQPAHK